MQKDPHGHSLVSMSENLTDAHGEDAICFEHAEAAHAETTNSTITTTLSQGSDLLPARHICVLPECLSAGCGKVPTTANN